jgi:23S rRNA (cytidine1920-2'-O)/16S rRNA (cytidine1409-2'-O)-methyltransferase
VRDPRVHRRVLEEHFTTATELGLGITGLAASPLRGPAGNIEFLAALTPNVSSIPMNVAIDRALAEAPPE